LAISRWLLVFLRIWDLGIGIWLSLFIVHSLTLHCFTLLKNKPFPVLRATFSEIFESPSLAAKILRIFRSFFLEKNEPRKARQRKSFDLPGFHFAKRFIPLASLGKSFAAAGSAAAPFKRQVPSLFQGAFQLLNR